MVDQSRIEDRILDDEHPLMKVLIDHHYKCTHQFPQASAIYDMSLRVYFDRVYSIGLGVRIYGEKWIGRSRLDFQKTVRSLLIDQTLTEKQIQTIILHREKERKKILQISPLVDVVFHFGRKRMR